MMMMMIMMMIQRQDIHKVVLCLPDSWSNWSLEMLGFEKRGKPDYLEKNLLEQRREPTTNSMHIIMASTPGFEPRPRWWGASALTTVPSLAPHILRQKSLILSTVKLPISNNPKCEDLVVGYRRWSLRRTKLLECLLRKGS